MKNTHQLLGILIFSILLSCAENHSSKYTLNGTQLENPRKKLTRADFDSIIQSSDEIKRHREVSLSLSEYVKFDTINLQYYLAITQEDAFEKLGISEFEYNRACQEINFTDSLIRVELANGEEVQFTY